MPQRVQRRRTKGWRMPPGTVYVGRGTKWGNPYTAAEYGKPWAAAQYEWWLQAHPDGQQLFGQIEQLRGKNLSCFCGLDEACHADVLLKLANKGEPSHD